MRPGRVYRIRLLLISRRSSCHLSLSLVTLRRHSLVVAGQGFFFYRFVTARFRRDRIKSFLFSSFLGGYTSLSTRSNGNFFSFLCSRLVFSRPFDFLPSSFPPSFLCVRLMNDITSSRLHEEATGGGSSAGTLLASSTSSCHARFLSRTVCFLFSPFFLLAVQFSGWPCVCRQQKERSREGSKTIELRMKRWKES